MYFILYGFAGYFIHTFVTRRVNGSDNPYKGSKIRHVLVVLVLTPYNNAFYSLFRFYIQYADYLYVSLKME